MRMLAVGVVVMGLALGGCGGGKKEPTPSERVAQVVDKGAATAPKAETKAPATAAPTTPAVAPDPAPTQPPPATKAPEPVAPPTEPAKVEPTPTEEPAKVEPTPTEEPAAKVEPTPSEEPSEPTSPTPSGTALHEISVNDSAMTLAIEDRFPSERKTSFTIGADPKVYAWFDFKNAGAKTPITLVWKKEGKEVWRIDTNVGTSKSWRTWAEKKIGKKDAGRWTVEAIDEGGYVYGTLSYEVLPE